MSRNRTYLPPKSTTNSQFLIDWDMVNRKKQIETLRPREIQVRKNHSFHAGSSDCNKSIFEKSFDDIYENQKNSQKFQKEFNQLKSLINSKQQQIEQSEKKRLSEHQHQNDIPKPLIQEIGNYHTFKPVFERLTSLIDVPKQNNQENIKIQTRLSTIFDSLEMESTRTSKDPQKVDSILQLVENLLKDCVIPILSQQKSLSSQKSQPQIFTLQSSQQLSNTIVNLRSMEGLFQDLIDLFKCTKESGYLKYQVQSKPVLIESVTQFNISKYQSCKLFEMHFEKEIQLDIAHKNFKSCVSAEACQIINQVLLIPVQYNNQRIIYVMNGFHDSLDYNFIQQNLQMQILRKSNSFIRLMSSVNKCLIQRINLFKLQTIIQLKSKVRRSNQQIINLYHYFLKIGLKRIKHSYIKPEQKQYNDKMYYVLLNYQTKLLNQAFRAIQGNEDQLIMIQALQTENSIEQYLKKVSMIIGEKMILSILNEEIQIMTSYIPDAGLYQEYIENVDDLSSYKSLNSITKPFNIELQNIGYDFKQRHIWQVTEQVYLITFSNMQSQYLSKLALVVTNALQYMRQKYLNVFSIVRNINQQSYKRVLTKYFERWRSQQQEQGNYEEDLQNLKLQNTIRTKYLSTALIQNIINRKQQTQKLQIVYMNEWRNQTRNEKNIQMRIRGGVYLMKRYIQSISKHNMIIAFREIAFSNFVNQSSPIVKNNTKRSIFTQREQSKRSQEELEQSVLWDVHQMRLNTPLHDQSYRTNKNPSPVTMNNSIQLTEYEINQYHSQRANQKRNSRNKSINSIDQENQPPPVGENRIYSKKTKDFVKKIQQTGHQRFNSTSPNMNVNKYNNTAFSFDENSEF